MEFESDKSRMDHCLLLLIAARQVMNDTGDLRAPAAVEFREALDDFYGYTMSALASIPDRDSLRVVD